MEKRKTTRGHRKPKATTEEIVGGAKAGFRVKPAWRKYFTRLVQSREELLHRRTESAQEAIEEKPSYSMHMADAGTDNYDRDLALAILSSEQDSLYEVEEALDRIRTGRYGICELTGKPIEPARLEAIPWTRFSSEAEKRLEKEDPSRRPRLGCHGRP
jgi:RNA polymerase-binding transcription factor DksA